MSAIAGGVDGQRGIERGEDEAGGAGHARALPLPEAAQAEDGASECAKKAGGGFQSVEAVVNVGSMICCVSGQPGA